MDDKSGCWIWNANPQVGEVLQLVYGRCGPDGVTEGMARYEWHCGQAVFIEVGGARYDGEFRHGAQEGRRGWRFADGSCYDSEFVTGLPHGYGEAVLDGVTRCWHLDC